MNIWQNIWYFIKEIFIRLIPFIILPPAIWLLLRKVFSLIRIIQSLPADYKLGEQIFRRFLPEQLDNFLPVYIPLREASDLSDNHWARWLGGPATLIIYDGVALYLERFACFSRTLGPGTLGPGLPLPKLKRYETIKAIVDLRPQTRTRDNIKTWTKDGVEVMYSVRAEFQIASSEEARKQSVVLPENKGAKNLIYPYDSDAVKLAVERAAVRLDNEKNVLRENNWMDGSMGTITGNLNGHIARNSINELLFQTPNSPQLLSFEISDDLFENINNNLNTGGTRLISLQITNFSPVDEEISNGLFQLWNAERERDNLVRKGEDDARRIRANQRAQTIAQQEILASLAENLSELNAGNPIWVNLEGFSETSILLMTQILDQNISDPILKTYLAREMLETFEVLKEQLGI